MSAGFAHPEYLVGTEWLAEHGNDPNVVVLDCTTHLIPNPKITYDVVPGIKEYEEGHVPGAQFVDLPNVLSDTSHKFRFMRPTPEDFAAAMGRFGVGEHSKVILYSTTSIQWASRVWWLLREFGHDNAAVLDGGFAKWKREGRAIATGPSQPRPPHVFKVRTVRNLMADAREVLGAIGDTAVCTLNALRPEQHSGTGGNTYGRPGRIKGSVNLPAGELVDRQVGGDVPRAGLGQRIVAPLVLAVGPQPPAPAGQLGGGGGAVVEHQEHGRAAGQHVGHPSLGLLQPRHRGPVGHVGGPIGAGAVARQVHERRAPVRTGRHVALEPGPVATLHHPERQVVEQLVGDHDGPGQVAGQPGPGTGPRAGGRCAAGTGNDHGTGPVEPGHDPGRGRGAGGGGQGPGQGAGPGAHVVHREPLGPAQLLPPGVEGPGQHVGEQGADLGAGDEVAPLPAGRADTRGVEPLGRVVEAALDPGVEPDRPAGRG